MLVVFIALAGAVALGYAAAAHFIAGSLADPRKEISRAELSMASKYVTGSAGLQSRLAEAYMIDGEPDLPNAQTCAENAVRLSPFNYSYKQQLALVQEMRGDRASAEKSLRSALALAPNNIESHWRLANLLVREGKITESYDSFRKAVGSNRQRFNSAIDLVWRATGGSVSTVEAITPGEPETKLALARFLVNQSRFDDAIKVLEASGSAALLPRSEVGSLINALTAAGLHERARTLWCDSLGAGTDLPIIWNGGFESSIDKNFNQFDWALTSSEFARINIDPNASHAGARSLRVDFTGRDTTRLGTEVRQMILVRPGKSYTLECWVKTQSLVFPDGPQIVVMDSRTSAVVAASPKIQEGSRDWQRVAVKFAAPAPANESSALSAALVVCLKRDPKYSYDDPAKGTLWLDDFAVREGDLQ